MNWVTRVPYSARINSPWNKLFRPGCFSIRNFDDLPRSTGFAPRKFRRLAESARHRLHARKSRNGHRDIRAPEGVAAIRRGGILHRRCSTFQIVGQPSGRSSEQRGIFERPCNLHISLWIFDILSRRHFLDATMDTMFLTMEKDYLVSWSFSILLFLFFFFFIIYYFVISLFFYGNFIGNFIEKDSFSFHS